MGFLGFAKPQIQLAEESGVERTERITTCVPLRLQSPHLRPQIEKVGGSVALELKGEGVVLTK